MLSALKSGHDFECARVTPGESWLAAVCCLCPGLSEAPGARERKSFGSTGESGWHITASTTDGLLFSSVAPWVSGLLDYPNRCQSPDGWMMKQFPHHGPLLLYSEQVKCWSLWDVWRTTPWPLPSSQPSEHERKDSDHFSSSLLTRHMGTEGRQGCRGVSPESAQISFFPGPAALPCLLPSSSEEKVLRQFLWPRLPWAPLPSPQQLLDLGKSNRLELTGYLLLTVRSSPPFSPCPWESCKIFC